MSEIVNAMILDLISTEKENAAIDSFTIKTCKNSTAISRRAYGSYKDRAHGVFQLKDGNTERR